MSQRYIREAIRKGEMPAVRFGRSVRIFRESLVRWVRRNEVTPPVDDVEPGDCIELAEFVESRGYK